MGIQFFFYSDYGFMNNILFLLQLNKIFTKIIINPRKYYSHYCNKK